MIKLPIDKVDRIYHLSDIHIRNIKRHTEYRSVFKKVYDEIGKNKENSVIYLGGDIVHAKLDMSPELIDLTSFVFEYSSTSLSCWFTSLMPSLAQICQ